LPEWDTHNDGIFSPEIFITDCFHFPAAKTENHHKYKQKMGKVINAGLKIGMVHKWQ
jgi:hypothetical protein